MGNAFSEILAFVVAVATALAITSAGDAAAAEQEFYFRADPASFGSASVVGTPGDTVPSDGDSDGSDTGTTPGAGSDDDGDDSDGGPPPFNNHGPEGDDDMGPPPFQTHW